MTLDIPKIFENESTKLKTMIDTINIQPDMPIPKIIEIYYQVMNVSSMCAMLKQQTDSEPKLLEKIQQVEKLIAKKFDSFIHPQIINVLSTLIQELTDNLQSKSSTEKSKTQTISDAKLFEKLRQNMSTREFVKQYESGLSHDC